MSLLKKIAKPFAPLAAATFLALAPQQAAADGIYIKASPKMLNYFEKAISDFYGSTEFLVDMSVGYEKGGNGFELDGSIGSPSVTISGTKYTFFNSEIALRFIKQFGSDSDDIRMFAGLQGSFNIIDERGESGGQTIYDSSNLTGWGAGVFGGIEFALSKTYVLFGEVGVDYASISLKSGGSLNPGGFFVKVGTKARF